MTADHNREWRESLGAYALGHLSDDERAGLEAHLEGCPDCRAELESLSSVARLLPLADPEQLDTPPSLPRGLGDRVMASIAGERRRSKRRRFRLGFGLSGATAAVAAAAMLAIFVLPGGGEAPSQHVSFASLPAKMKIGASLEPQPFGTEVRVYVSGVRSGELCRVFLEAKDGTEYSAGSFRYRWGDESLATLSSGLDLARTRAIGIRVGHRTFVESVEGGIEQS
jgi:Putative zinc-finger